MALQRQHAKAEPAEAPAPPSKAPTDEPPKTAPWRSPGFTWSAHVGCMSRERFDRAQHDPDVDLPAPCREGHALPRPAPGLLS